MAKAIHIHLGGAKDASAEAGAHEDARDLARAIQELIRKAENYAADHRGLPVGKDFKVVASELKIVASILR